MTFNEIKELTTMGFTPEQIMALSGSQQPEPQPEGQPEPQPEGQPEPQPEGQPEPQPEGQPEPQPEPQPQEDTRITELQNQINDLKKQLQKQNRLQARMDTPPDDLDKNVDAIMAELIRPTIKEDKKP